MTNPTPSERALELDEKATDGPWSWINANSSIGRAGRLFGVSDLILDSEAGIFADNFNDVNLIAEYRTLCPQLARDNQALKKAVTSQRESISIAIAAMQMDFSAEERLDAAEQILKRALEGSHD